METVLYWVGFCTTLFGAFFLLWWIGLRHVLYGLNEAIAESRSLANLDFRCTDPNKLNVEVAKHFSNWDKLWLVPRHFRNVFFCELKYHWKYH